MKNHLSKATLGLTLLCAGALVAASCVTNTNDPVLELPEPTPTPQAKKTPFESISSTSPGTSPGISPEASVEKGFGPLVLAQCHDASQARFVLDAQGGMHVLTARFFAPSKAREANTPRVLVTEFSRARIDDEATVTFEALAGSVDRTRLVDLAFAGLDQTTGQVSVAYGNTLAEFSGCQFNVAALKKMRGQERLPLVVPQVAAVGLEGQRGRSFSFFESFPVRR